MTAPSRLTYCMYSWYQIHPHYYLPHTPQSLHSPSDILFISLEKVKFVTCITSSHYMDSHRLVKGVHELVQKKTTMTEWQDCSFPPLLSWESEASTCPLPMWHPVVSRTHCRKHYHHLLSHTRAFILIIWGCWKNVKDTLKTKKAPGSLNCPHWAASSRLRKFLSSAFLHRRNSSLSWPVEPGETNSAGKPWVKEKRTNHVSRGHLCHRSYCSH